MSASYLLSVTSQSCEFHKVNNKGPIYMVLSTQGNPLTRATLLGVWCLYEKELPLLAKSKLNLPDYVIKKL